MDVTDGVYDFSLLTEKVFSHEPLPPHSFSFSLMDEADPKIVPQLLGNFLSTGAKMKFNKPELGLLTEREIEILREYLLSIGWDMEYSVERINLPMGLHKNHYKIQFKSAAHR